jgi:hypothetical protein
MQQTKRREDEEKLNKKHRNLGQANSEPKKLNQNQKPKTKTKTETETQFQFQFQFQTETIL